MVGRDRVFVPYGSGIATTLSIGDGQGDVQGVWYMEIPADSGTPVFERLPSYAFGGNIIRSLTLGAEGHVNWIRHLEDGLHIYRR